LHIVDSALAEAHALRPGAPLGLLATRGTRHSGLFPKRSGAATVWFESNEDEQARFVDPGIDAVKRGRIDVGAALLIEAARCLVRRGAGVLVMGCTEVPLALQGQPLEVPAVDTNAALARACVRWARERAAEAELGSAVAAA
ncbi:MAG: aspartate/glutamate racemase family protein, partial [Pseudomonadota bacterium]|nr:aspartate/glutamate racemase family protein [Pseudomonadota bacterium]